MSVPKLKRIRVASLGEARTWLLNASGRSDPVLIVTADRTSSDRHVSSAAIREVLCEYGWTPGMSYTLGGGLLGHVATPP